MPAPALIHGGLRPAWGLPALIPIRAGAVGWAGVGHLGVGQWPQNFLLGMPSRLIVLVLLSGSVALGAPQSQAQTQTQPQAKPANMKDQIILGACSQAMASELSLAGKTAPAGMVSETCGCVVTQLNKKSSLDQAKQTCKQMAAAKYGL